MMVARPATITETSPVTRQCNNSEFVSLHIYLIIFFHIFFRYLVKGNLRLKDGSPAHQKAVAKLSATSTEGPNWKHWRIRPYHEKGFVVFESLVSAGLMESGAQNRVNTYTYNLDPNNTPKFRKAIEKQMIE